MSWSDGDKMDELAAQSPAHEHRKQEDDVHITKVFEGNLSELMEMLTGSSRESKKFTDEQQAALDMVRMQDESRCDFFDAHPDATSIDGYVSAGSLHSASHLVECVLANDVATSRNFAMLHAPKDKPFVIVKVTLEVVETVHPDQR